MLTAILFMAAQATADGDRWAQVQAAVNSAPKDVTNFIERRMACNHWDGEVGSEYLERERMIQAERKKLRCNCIDADERALRKAHHDSPSVLKLLDDTKEMPPF
jgi:hypothetical protein